MTDIDLDAIKARIAAATPGPWDTDGTTVWAYMIVPDPRDQTGQTPMQDRVLVAQSGGADADLIAHAPTDLAALVAVVRALRAVAVAAEQVAGAYANPWASEDDRLATIDALAPALDALDAGGEGASAIKCPGCGLPHDPEPCRREAAQCDCCAAIYRAGGEGS